jgi:hypothetical protein
MRCLVDGCPGDMRGQMVVCAPHWTYLSEDLRREAVKVRNELDAQMAEGNPRRATRDAWRALLPRMTEELLAARVKLEQELGEFITVGGVAWQDASRKIKARVEEAAAASEAASA